MNTTPPPNLRGLGSVCLALLGAALFATAHGPSVADDAKPAAARPTPQKTEKAKNAKDSNGATAKDKTEKKAGQSKDAAGETAEAAAEPVKAKETADDKKEEEKADPKNPLANFFRRLFRPTPKPPPGKLIDKPDDKSEVKGDPQSRDFIDRRAPYDREHVKLLNRADKMIRGDQPDRGLELLQKHVIEREEDSIMRLPNNKWVSIRERANTLLASYSEDIRDRYELLYGGFARNLLDEARSQGAQEKYVVLATRFINTQAGLQAANDLANLHFDRGNFGNAAYWFRKLQKRDVEFKNDPHWKLKAAVALRAAGDHDGSQQFLNQLASAAGEVNLVVGGTAVDDAAGWIDGLGPLDVTSPQVLEDWPVFFGTPARRGTTVGGDPLLLERWSQPLTFSQPIRDQTQVFLDDLNDRNMAAVPAFHPIMVDGKIVFRTLAGVTCVDAATGVRVWSSEQHPGSPENLLVGIPQSGSQTTQAVPFGQGIQGGILQQLRGQETNRHPLANLFFRNGLYGMISSDGERVFVLERQALLSQRQPAYGWGVFGRSSRSSDPLRRDWTSNAIAAYDLETGKTSWDVSVGGPAMGEPFDPPLAGTYFFSTPVYDSGELFVLGEKDGAIRLYSLDPKTGRPVWSQWLADADAKIERDYGRRWWTAQVAVDKGIIVCPTTAGWLMGVDRQTHSVLWAQRYSQPNPSNDQRHRFRGNNQNGMVVQQTELNKRWCPSAPVIVGDRVIYAPPEYSDYNRQRSSAVCLGLFDGEKKWSKPKDENLYVAGVFDDRMVLVGTNEMSAVAVQKGTQSWTLRIPEEDGHTCGMGAAAGNRYYLPLSSGQVWSVDLATGKVTSKTHGADYGLVLGNLAMYRGMLLSLSPLGLTAFELKDSVEEQIRQRKAEDPVDPWALLTESDIHRLNRDYQSALDLLRKIPTGHIPRQLNSRYRQTMIECLSAVIRSDFKAYDQETQELGRFVKSNAETRAYRRLLGEQAHARGQFQKAFDHYWELIEGDRDVFVRRSDDPSVQLHLDRWLGTRFARLWKDMPADLRTKLDARVDAVAQQVLNKDVTARDRFVTRFHFHPLATLVRRSIAETYASESQQVAGRLLRAENELLKLSREPSPAVAASALERLARLWRDEQPQDAAYFYRLLEKRFPDVPVAEGKTAGQLLAELRQSGQLPPRKPAGRKAVWGDFDLQMEQSSTNHSSSSSGRIQVLTGRGRLPYFQNHRLEVVPNYQMLAVVKPHDESLNWIGQLRSKTRSSQGNYVGWQIDGHQLIVLHKDVVHCISPAEKRVLWKRPLDIRSGASGYYRSPSIPQVSQMRRDNQGQYWLTNRNSSNGMLAVANPEYVCVYGRREFQVLDAMTGKVRWKRSDVPMNTTVVGNEHMLFVLRQDRSQSVALRARDGKRLDIPDVSDLLSDALHISNDGLVLLERKTLTNFLGFTRAKLFLRSFDPVADKEHWKKEYPYNSEFAPIDDQLLAVFKPTGELQLVDLSTGESTPVGSVPENDLRSRRQTYVLADDDIVYLIVNKNYRGSYYSSSSSMPSLRVNGLVFAFDRHKGKLLWKQKVLNNNLVRQQFRQLPILIFSGQNYERKGNTHVWNVTLKVLDKRTGRVLVDSKTPTNYGSFQFMQVNMADRMVELKSYNLRVRLTAVDRKKNDKTTAQNDTATNAETPAVARPEAVPADPPPAK